MPEPSPLPDQVTMPLLTRITQQSFDEDYTHVAERRRSRDGATAQPEGGSPSGGRGGSHRTAAVVAAVFGIMVATAGVQAYREAGANSASRSTLVQQISARSEGVARKQAQIVQLRSTNVGLGERLAEVTRADQEVGTRLQRLETTTGFGAVTGEGVRIVVDDAPGGDVTQLVRDEDLALLADGLWNAGAEAISVNGQRLSALSSIRNVGITIKVNSRAVSPPYTVKAIGDTATLQARLLESTHGQDFYSLVDHLGFVFDVQNEDSLSLPAAPLRRLLTVTAGTAEQNRDQRSDQQPNQQRNQLGNQETTP